MLYGVEIKGNGIVFPGTIEAPSGKSLQLVAVGTRQMSVFKFGLYSIGLYLEPNGIKAISTGPSRPTVNEAVKTVLDGQYEWSLRIVPLRNGSMAHLRDALVRRFKASASTPNDAEIASFASHLPNNPLQKGSQVFFHWSIGDGLLIKHAEADLGLHRGEWTCKQLLRIYTDETASTVPQVHYHPLWSLHYTASLLMSSMIPSIISIDINTVLCCYESTPKEIFARGGQKDGPQVCRVL